LQTGLVHGFSRSLHQRRQDVAVGPVDVLEVNLESGVAVEPGLADHGLVEFGLGDGIGGQSVKFLLVVEADQGHHRQLFVVRSFQHGWIGSAGNQPILVHRIPGGYQQVDLRGVRLEGATRVRTVEHVEEGNGFCMETRDCRESRPKQEKKSFHHSPSENCQDDLLGRGGSTQRLPPRWF